MKMLKKFLTSNLSAAGVSHVVTEKSPFRRLLWIVALLLISVAMMLMTYNVLQEYLKYPTNMSMKRFFLKEMEFPAVTVCGYNLIPRHNHIEADLKHMEDFHTLLVTMPKYNVSIREKVRCLKDPLCRWSRFLDKCYCDKKACTSTECYPNYKNKSVCTCSQAICLPDVGEFARGCSVLKDDGIETCVCSTDFEYPLHAPIGSNLSPDFLEAVDRLNTSPEVKDLLMTLKTSNITNLRDVERLIQPTIYVRDNYGMSYEDLILSCTFGALPCNQSRDVSTLYSPSFGKCYSFNYAGEQNAQSEVKVVKHAGKPYGLQLLLKSPRMNAFPLFSPHYGARVVVHDPRSLPFATQNGFDVRSGDSSSVIVRYAEVNRLRPPWNDCAIDGDNDTTSYLFKPYSMLGCERNCINEHVFKRCGCYHERLLSGTLFPIRSQICKREQDECMGSIIMDKNAKRISCRCPSACREKRYDVVSISAGKINRDFYRLLKMVKTLKMIDRRPAVAEPEFNQGMMSIHVYFGSLAITNTSENSIYSWEFLVANVGGNLGLFLGLSLITFVEIAEFAVDIAVQTFCPRTSRN